MLGHDSLPGSPNASPLFYTSGAIITLKDDYESSLLFKDNLNLNVYVCEKHKLASYSKIFNVLSKQGEQK